MHADNLAHVGVISKDINFMVLFGKALNYM